MPVSKSLKRKRYQPKLSPVKENNNALNKNHYKRIYKNPLKTNKVDKNDNLNRNLFNAWLRILQHNANRYHNSRIPVVLYGAGGNRRNNFKMKGYTNGERNTKTKSSKKFTTIDMF